MKNKICLVLEGGALRGLYTAGVLDALYENKIDVDCIIGVSAGALFGVNYFSNQPKRVLRYNKKYCKDKRYISLLSLIFTGNVVNKRFAYYKVSKKLDVFDQDEFIKTNKPYYAVTTNIETGEAEYILVKKPMDEMEILRASSAMPLLSRIVKIDNKKYLDGAVADSIPIKKAIEMGYKKIIVVLTQPDGYKKKELTNKQIKAINRRYKKYPRFIDASIKRPSMYNDTIKYIKKLENKKEIFVFRPNKSIDINPIKKTVNDLDEAYMLGYNDGINYLESLNNYVNN